MRRRHRLLLLAGILPAPAWAQTAQALAEIPDTVVQARRFDAARNAISPTLGAQVSTLERGAIDGLPQGLNAPINELLLTFPGVVRDSFGEIHIRGEHRNLQYRVNGVTIPEGIQGFGAFVDARGLRSLSLLTGALPAQFGYRTAGATYRPWEGARASTTLFYGNGLRRGFANTEKQPSYTTLNLGFAQDFRVAGGGLRTARLDLINLTDQVVQLRDGSGIGVGAPQFLRRRAVYAGLSRAF